MLAFSFARCTARPSHAWAHTGLGASLERSPAATPLCCSGFGRAAELAARCALRSNSRSESEHEERSRAPTLTLALLGVPEAPPGRCAQPRSFAEALLIRQRWCTWVRGSRRAVCGGAISAVARSAGGSVGARSAQRAHARCGCLSGMERSAMQRVPQRNRPPSIAAEFSRSENHRSMSPAAHRPPRTPRVKKRFTQTPQPGSPAGT